MMTVLAVLKASQAEIKVGTVLASDEFISRKFCLRQYLIAMIKNAGCLTVDAAVAGALSIIMRWADRSIHLLLLDLARGTGLGDAWKDDSVADESFDQPVLLIIASHSSIVAGRTQVEVAFLADAAVIVLIWDGLAAEVAVDAEGASREVMERR